MLPSAPRAGSEFTCVMLLDIRQWAAPLTICGCGIQRVTPFIPVVSEVLVDCACRGSVTVNCAPFSGHRGICKWCGSLPSRDIGVVAGIANFCSETDASARETRVSWLGHGTVVTVLWGSSAGRPSGEANAADWSRRDGGVTGTGAFCTVCDGAVTVDNGASLWYTGLAAVTTDFCWRANGGATSFEACSLEYDGVLLRPLFEPSGQDDDAVTGGGESSSGGDDFMAGIGSSALTFRTQNCA